MDAELSAEINILLHYKVKEKYAEVAREFLEEHWDHLLLIIEFERNLDDLRHHYKVDFGVSSFWL